MRRSDRPGTRVNDVIRGAVGIASPAWPAARSRRPARARRRAGRRLPPLAAGRPHPAPRRTAVDPLAPLLHAPRPARPPAAPRLRRGPGPARARRARRGPGRRRAVDRHQPSGGRLRPAGRPWRPRSRPGPPARWLRPAADRRRPAGRGGDLVAAGRPGRRLPPGRRGRRDGRAGLDPAASCWRPGPGACCATPTATPPRGACSSAGWLCCWGRSAWCTWSPAPRSPATAPRPCAAAEAGSAGSPPRRWRRSSPGSSPDRCCSFWPASGCSS